MRNNFWPFLRQHGRHGHCPDKALRAGCRGRSARRHGAGRSRRYWPVVDFFSWYFFLVVVVVVSSDDGVAPVAPVPLPVAEVPEPVFAPDVSVPVLLPVALLGVAVPEVSVPDVPDVPDVPVVPGVLPLVSLPVVPLPELPELL